MLYTKIYLPTIFNYLNINNLIAPLEVFHSKISYLYGRKQDINHRITGLLPNRFYVLLSRKIGAVKAQGKAIVRIIFAAFETELIVLLKNKKGPTHFHVSALTL